MSGNYSTGRLAGREHVPVYPKGFIAIRIVQLVVAVVILGLDAYSLSEILTTGSELNIFTVCRPLVLRGFFPPPLPWGIGASLANIGLISRPLQP